MRRPCGTTHPVAPCIPHGARQQQCVSNVYPAVHACFKIPNVLAININPAHALGGSTRLDRTLHVPHLVSLADLLELRLSTWLLVHVLQVTKQVLEHLNHQCPQERHEHYAALSTIASVHLADENSLDGTCELSACTPA